MPKIQLRNLQKIIREEISRSVMLEGEHAKSAIDHASAATRCLDAIEKYKEAATSKALSEMQSELDKVEQILNRVVASPLVYADPVPEDSTDSSGRSSQVLKTSGPSAKTVKPKVIKKGTSQTAM